MIRKIRGMANRRFTRQLIALILILLSTVLLAACKQETKQTVTISEDDEVLRTGQSDGFVYNVYNNYIGIADFTGRSDKLEIPSELEGLPVAKLEDGFAEGTIGNYSEIILPETLVRIGDGALSGSDWNGSVKIPGSVSHIGKGALDGISFDADKNGFVIVGDGVLIRYEGSGGDITLPSSVRVIATAFMNNDNVKSVKVDKHCRELSACAFAFSSVNEITLPDSVEIIGKDCFRGSKLMNIRMPSGECRIGRNAFETSGSLSMTVQENSGSMLWAIENDISFRLENGDGKLLDGNYLKPVGAGEHEFSENGTLRLNVDEKLISADKKRAAVISFDSDMTGILRFVDLRTLRVVDRVDLSRDTLMRAIDGYPTESRDYSDCELSGSLDPIGWESGNFILSGEFLIRHDDDEWNIVATFSCSPDSGYLAVDSLTTNAVIPDYLAGYIELASTDDGSARLYAKPESDSYASPLIIRWTFGSINVEIDTLDPDSAPTLELSDLSGDGLKDLILSWNKSGSGAESSQRLAGIFFGPTGSKRVFVDPLGNFNEKAALESKNGGDYIVSDFGEYYIALSEENEPLNIGKYTQITIAGDYLIADLSTTGTCPTVRMLYKFIGGEMKLIDIFTSEFSLPIISDDISSLWHIGYSDYKQKFLVISNGAEAEFGATGSRIFDCRLDHADFDGDGIQDTAVITCTEPGTVLGGEMHTEQCFVLTSSDRKLREIKVEEDTNELFTITNFSDYWHFVSRFGEFDISKNQFDLEDEYFYGTKIELSDKPSLTTSYHYSVVNDSIICDMDIDCTGIARHFASQFLRLTYRLDSFFRVKNAELIDSGTTELSMDFETLTGYLIEAETGGIRNDTLTVNLTDRGRPTLSISFENGYPTLVSMRAKNQTLKFESPLKMVGNLKFEIFDVGYLVIESLYCDMGDTYIFSDDSIVRNFTEYGQDTDDYLSFFEKDGELCYQRTAMRYNAIDLGQGGIFLILDSITSRDDFWKETGKAEIIDGGLVLTPEESFTISDYVDLDAEFNKHHDYVANFNSLDEVIARNLGRLTSTTDQTAISITFGEFKNEVAGLMKTGTSKTLVATITDVDNAVLTIEKNNSGTFLTKIEARGSFLKPSVVIAFDNSPELTLFAADEMTALQVVHTSGACDRYLFEENADIYEEHDSESDAQSFTTRWSEQDGKVHFEKRATGYLRRILSGLTSRDALYLSAGYFVRADDQSGLSQNITEETKLSEIYDLDAEFEKLKSTDFRNFNTLDELIAYNKSLLAGNEIE